MKMLIYVENVMAQPVRRALLGGIEGVYKASNVAQVGFVKICIFGLTRAMFQTSPNNPLFPHLSLMIEDE